MKVELRGVTKRLGAQTVIADLTATLDFAHTLALIGPSGGGKSTLLRLLAGLLVPDAGEITIDGRPLPRDERGLRTHRAGLGIVFQAFNLFPHLSALENIRLPLVRVHGLSAAEATERALAVLERFQLANHARKHPDALSGGQRQRVAIARAVATQPQFLLLDEPTSALDPEMTAEVLGLLAELRAEGRTMILVTHAMGFARQAADLVAFVAEGGFLEIGPPEAIFTQSAQEPVCRFLSKVLRY
jgi:polar amino acid transport system ATP-binding protein